MKRAYKRRLDKLTNECADERLQVPVAGTGRSKRELSIEESQLSTIGEANQRTSRRMTGRGSCRLRRANHRRLEKLTNERADGRSEECLWPLPTGQRGSRPMERANHRRIEKLTNGWADGILEVPVAVTGQSKREPSNEESQPSTIGEANQRVCRRNTGSACGRYRPVKEGAVD
nr:unnamed protein product [Spirometra erinaceieuropaei]